jgi:phosphoribosylformimino-5-aminoimidazole carboxamide ribotide isomerase
MRIIPVIDLKGGVVVRGVGGRRDEYRPIRSILADSPDPIEIASALRRHFGFDELYLADLDAIAGAEPAWAVYGRLLEDRRQLWLDAGIGDLARARQLAELERDGCRLFRIVVGLESLASAALLPALADILTPERLTLSIDLKAGQSLAADGRWRDMPPPQIAAEAIAAGVRRVIVLDLASVGENRGPSALARCVAIRQIDAHVELVSGGGVRGVDDLRALAASGCDAALVASALHDGRLSASDLRAFALARSASEA